MNPERRFRQLRDDDRWVDLPPTNPGATSEAGRRQRTNAVRLAVAIVIALALVVPASIYAFTVAGDHPAGGSRDVGPTAISSPGPVVTPSTSTPTSSPTPALADGKGCAPTSATTPRGAVRAKIQDVDGDGRQDTEWAERISGTGDVRFGITTASGATFSATADFAGGAARTFVAAKLANGAVILMPSEGRGTDLWSLSECTLREVRSTVPTYSGFFGISITTNDGGGAATCIDGRLASISWKADGSTTDTFTARFIDVAEDGTTATLTDTRKVLAQHVPFSSDRYSGISCGASPVLRLN